MQWTVDRKDAGIRLDTFLASRDRLGSRRRASDALARGQVFVNGGEAAAGESARPVAEGDVVRAWIDRPGRAKRRSRSRSRELNIVYEDDALIVLDKPAGLLAVPLARRSEAPSAYDQVVGHLRSRGKIRPLVVHRIDRDTSGLVVFAKHPAAQAGLREQFRRHCAERIYRAVVYGRPQPSSGTWRDRLVWDQRALIQKRTHPRDPRGRDAISEYRVLEQFPDAALIEVRLITGRRNQIRLQARLRGHTLVGERRYVYGPELLRPIPFRRQALHAFQLGFDHPASGKPLRLEAPIPSDMAALLDRLRQSKG